MNLKTFDWRLLCCEWDWQTLFIILFPPTNTENHQQEQRTNIQKQELNNKTGQQQFLTNYLRSCTKDNIFNQKLLCNNLLECLALACKDNPDLTQTKECLRIFKS